MDNVQIDSHSVRLRVAYMGLWLVAMLIVVIGEGVEPEWIGLYAADDRAAYVLHTVVILLTVACVPLSLRGFAWMMAHRLPVGPERLGFYVRLSLSRLLLLALPAWAGLVAYYLTLSHTGVLCALIALTASLFSVPSGGRMRRELCQDDDED